jgi:hypothetical protein
MQADPPPGQLSEWIGEWLEYLWSKRPRAPKPSKDGGGFYSGVWHDVPPEKKPHDLLDNFKGKRKAKKNVPGREDDQRT